MESPNLNPISRQKLRSPEHSKKKMAGKATEDPGVFFRVQHVRSGERESAVKQGINRRIQRNSIRNLEHWVPLLAALLSRHPNIRGNGSRA